MFKNWLFLALLAITAHCKKVDVTHTIFESGIDDIQWMRQDSNVVMVLTAAKRLWRSVDGGRQFTDITTKISTKDPPLTGRGTFESFTVHPKDSTVGFLQGTDQNHYVTIDSGANWSSFGKPMKIFNFVFHPSRPNHALFSKWNDGCKSGNSKQSVGEDCYHVLYLTRDLGRSSTVVANYVVQYNWGEKEAPDGIQDHIFFTFHSQAKGHQNRYGGWHLGVDFAVSKDFGRSKEVLVRGGNKFLVSRRYVFVAQVQDILRQTVQLMVSSNYGKSFKLATIPTTLKEKSYTILDTSEGGVLIHVNHGTTTQQLEGNVYVSDPEGLRFALSLPNNIRSASGECEFDRVLGLDGIYIANFRDSLDRVMNGTIKVDNSFVEGESAGDALNQRHNKKVKRTAPIVRTVISFDKGGYWRYLKPPSVDSLGKAITCEDPDKCFLHLHGITHFDRFAPFYSIENALGIVMGTGNVGSHLTKDDKEVNTYISRDGGLTWYEAHKGAFIYEYGDHGGLVVMANDVKATDQVVFSWNEGHSWYDFDLGLSDVEVDNVVIEPTSGGLEFLLYGSRGDRGTVFHMDFATLGQPRCQGSESPNAVSSDYETWSPSDGSDAKCLLGRTLTYVRRRVTSECFNGRNFQRQKSKQPCTCSQNNFECEVGFFRQVGVEGGVCEPSPYGDRDYMTVEGCTSSGVYRTHAYRKVPGDECVGGFHPEKVAVPCPLSSPLPHDAKATLGLVAVFIGAIFFIAWASRHPTLRKYFVHSGFDSFLEVGYQVVGRAGESVQKGGEELYNFWAAAASQQQTDSTRLGIVTLQKSGEDDEAFTGIDMNRSIIHNDPTPVQERTSHCSDSNMTRLPPPPHILDDHMPNNNDDLFPHNDFPLFGARFRADSSMEGPP